jgi:hypothetical protein
VFAAAVLATNVFLSSFGGAWSCMQYVPGSPVAGPTHWTIAAAPKSAWSIVQWGSLAHDHGTAFVAYLPPDRSWLYADFHNDGSVATSTSTGPQNGVWTWSGEFVTQAHIYHGAITWQRRGKTLRQGFGRLLGTSFRESAHAECTKVPN